jgi:hypothetical protein
VPFRDDHILILPNYHFGDPINRLKAETVGTHRRAFTRGRNEVDQLGVNLVGMLRDHGYRRVILIQPDVLTAD